MFMLFEDLPMFGTAQIIGLSVSIIVPIIVATPASYYLLLQREKLKLANQELNYLLRYDPLTSLQTRRSFLKDASDALNASRRKNKNYTVFYIDIDQFKKINDSHGHLIGDKTLEIFGSTLSSILSQNDIAGRLGGEEFCILTCGYDTSSATNVAKAIVQQFQRDAEIIDNVKVNGTLSIGLASSMSDNLEELMHKADIQLYRAKKTGRNKYCHEQKV